MVVPESGILRNPETGLISGSPFLRGIVVIVAVSFTLLGFVYGRLAGTMHNDRDVVNAMAKSMSSLGLYIVLVFFAAQFVALFNWSNFGTVTAIAGADLLESRATRPRPVCSVHYYVCIRQFVVGQRLCAVGGDGSHLCPHVDVNGLRARGHPSSLSYR